MKIKQASSLAVLVLLSLSLVFDKAALAKPKKLEVAPAFQTARSICVETEEGGPSRSGTRDSDQDVIRQVQLILRDWNRYEVVAKRENADLVLVIRKGHRGEDQSRDGAGLPSPSMQPVPPRASTPSPLSGSQNDNPGVGPAVSDSVASEDLLRVYTVNEKGKLKGPIWSRQRDGGLDGPSVPLVQELEHAVEAAYPRDTAKPPVQ